MDKARYPEKEQKTNKPKSNFENLAMSFQSSFSHSGLQSSGNLPGQSGEAHDEIEFLQKKTRRTAALPSHVNRTSPNRPSQNFPQAPFPPIVNIANPQAPLLPTVNITNPQAPLLPTVNITNPQAPLPPTVNIANPQANIASQTQGHRQSTLKQNNLQHSKSIYGGEQTLAENACDSSSRQEQTLAENACDSSSRQEQTLAENTWNSSFRQEKTLAEDVRSPLYYQDKTLAEDARSSLSPQEKTFVDELDFLADGETPCGDTNSAKPAKTVRDPFYLIGTVLKGKYHIEKFIGQGGMGAVYLGRHKALGKERAIKTLIKAANANPNLVKRFATEARAAASVEHPNVVQVHDIDESDRFYFIVMEYVKGQSLQEILQEKGAFPEKEAVRIIGEASQGLIAIHDTGLIHRDIKPANLLLNDRGNVKITDFGIVKEVGGDTQLTGDTIIGTPQFMAPEQITKSGIDYRSDIYALGASFYYLVTGQHCFTGTTMQLMYQIVHTEPISPSEVDSHVSARASKVILKMIAKNPNNRQQNMREVCQDLATI